MPPVRLQLIKAMHFIKRYTDKKGEEWQQVNDGLIASFVENGIEAKVIYDKKGLWSCTMRTLDETQLPFELRDIAKSKYYDFNIVIAFEIEHESGVTYILKMLSKTRMKVLRINNGEMEVIEDYTSSCQKEPISLKNNAAVSPKAAATTSSIITKIPIVFSGFLPCANDGNGEIVVETGMGFLTRI